MSLLSFAAILLLPLVGMGQSAAETPWARLRQSFQQAKAPKAGDLPGEWVQTQNVSTQKFISGKAGADFVLSDSHGIRREDLPDRPLEWTLSIRTGADGRLLLTSHTAWVPTGDVSVARFNAQGDLIFGKDYGGDSMWIYRCRSASATHLVCVIQGPASGHGIEFRRKN